MPAPARSADTVVEALVERSRIEGGLSMEQLRSAFDDAGIGPTEARTVLRQLSEQGAVLGSEEQAPRARRTKTSAARPTKRTTGPQETRPAGRTVTSGSTTETPAETPAEEPDVTITAPSTTAAAPAAAAPAAKAPAKRATAKKAPAKKPAAPAEAGATKEPVRKQTKEEAAAAIAEAALPDSDTVFAEPAAPVVVSEEDKPLALDEPPPGIDLVKAYLREIGRVALLTAEMEVDLAKRIEAGLFATEKMRQVSVGELKLAAAMKRDLAEIIKDGDVAKRHLLEANLRLVVSLAKRYQGRGLDLLDLVQEGNLGLVRAVEKFDYAKGYKFSTYATWWIRQAL